LPQGVFILGAPARHSMNRKFTFLAITVIVLIWTGVRTARAVDYADPSDLIQGTQHQNATMEGSNFEVDGMIESVKPGNPGWYSIYLKLDNGNELTLIVYPKTKFWFNYKPLDAASACQRFVHGQKLRIMHNTFLDTYLKHEMITDMMFVNK